MSSGRRPRTKSRVEECASVSLDGISISLDATLKLEKDGEKVNICSRLKTLQKIRPLKKTNWWPQIFPGPSHINESIMASSIHPSISTPVIYHAPLSRPRIESESTRARQGHGPPRGPRCLRPPRPKIARRCRRRGFLAAATNRTRWLIDPNISRYIHSSSHPCGEMEMNQIFYRNLTCDDYRIIIHHGSFMHFTGFVFIPYPSSSSLLITAITLSPTLQCPFNDVLYTVVTAHNISQYHSTKVA